MAKQTEQEEWSELQKELNFKKKEEIAKKSATLKELMEQKKEAEVAAFFGLNKTQENNNVADNSSIFENITAPNYVDIYNPVMIKEPQGPNYVEDSPQYVESTLNTNSIQNNVPLFAMNNNNVNIENETNLLQINMNNVNNSPNHKKNEKKEKETEYVPSVSETQSLKENSKLHQFSLETKGNYEIESQKIHSNLWNFIVQTKSIEAFCGCMNTVSYPYNFRTAVFNDAQFAFLRKKFYELHQYNIRPVFMSLYRQTFSELQLCFCVHYTISHLLPTIDNLKEKFEKLKEIIDPLFSIISSNNLSEHSSKMVQSLILYASTHVITPQLCDSSEQENHQLLSKKEESESSEEISSQNLLDLNVEESKAPLKVSSDKGRLEDKKIRDKIVKYFVTKLSESNTTNWGGALIQPSIKQTIDLHILIKCSSIMTLSQDTTENHFISVLRQIPWEFITAIKSKDKLRSEIIFPLKQIIEFAAPKGFTSLLLLIGNILIVVAYLIPDLAFECIQAISSGVFPMKVICISLLQFAPFQSFTENQIDSIFSSIYSINQSPADYIKSGEQDRYHHRVNTLLNIIKFPILPPPSADARHPPAAPKVQNLFHLFYLLANLSPTYGHLQRLITQELFFYSFVFYADRNLPNLSPFEHSLISLLRSQAYYYLQLLCSHYPQLISTVIYCIAQNIYQPLNIDKLLEFINPTLFHKWKIDPATIFYLRYFFARRRYPENITVINNEIPRNQIEDLFQFPSVEFPPPVADIAIKIGTKVLSSVIYHKLSYQIRMQIALLLVTSSAVVHGIWIVEMLFGSIGNQLFATPIEASIAYQILQVDYHSVIPQSQSEFIVLQQLVALSLQEEINYTIYANPNQVPIEQSNILSRTNFYSRFSYLISQGKVNLIAKLFSKINRELNPKSLRSIFDMIFQSDQFAKYGYQPKNILLLLQTSMIESLLTNSHLDAQKDENYSAICRDQRFNGWVDTLLPTSRHDKNYLTLLNDLIAFIYCTGDKLNYVVNALANMKFTMQDVIGLQQDGYLWVSLMVLFSYKPIAPSSVKNKDNAFYILQEIPKYSSHSAISVAYWLHYFKVYFAMDIKEEYVPKNVKENLNKYFISEAKYFEAKDRVIYRVFYAFSTWKKDIIDASTGDFLQEQNIQLLKSLYLLLPSHFHFPINVSQFDMPEYLPATVYTANQQQEEMTIKHLLNLLPPPLPPPSKQLSSSVELDQFITLDQALQNSISYFVDLNQSYNDQSAISDQLQVPITQQLHLLFRSYNNLCMKLEELDNEFLDITRNMHINNPVPFQVLVACARGRDCNKPAVISGMSIEIEQLPDIAQVIQQNRILYDTEYRLFFDISRSIAQAVMLLKGTIDHLLRSKNFSQSLILSLFYSILKENIFTPFLPPHSVITSDLLSVLLSIGKEYINDMSTQLQLLHFLLNVPSELINPPLVKNNIDNIYNDSKIAYQAIDLYSLYRPSILLQNSTMDYLKSLYFIANNSTKSPEEEIYLASCYNLNEYLEAVATLSLSDEEIDLIGSTITLLFAKKNQIYFEIAGKLITLLLTAGHQQKLFSILFSEQIPAQYCENFISNLDYKSITLPIAVSILTNLLNHLPVKPHHTNSIEKLIRNLTVKLPAFVEQFQAENNSSYDEEGRPVQSPLWNLLYQIFDTSIISPPLSSSSSSYSSLNQPHYLEDNSLNQPRYLEDNIIDNNNNNNVSGSYNNYGEEGDDINYARIFELLFDIVSLAGASMVDKLWFLFSKSILPSYAKRKNSANPKPYPKCEYIIDQFASALPWSLCRFIYYDQQSLAIMSDTLLFAPNLIISIFCQLNLDHFLESLAQSQNQKIISQVGVQLLKLYFEINLIDPTAISPDLKSQLIDRSIKWQSIDPEIFSNTFTGNVFLNIIKSGVLYSDPTQSLVDNALTLRSIAIQISHSLSMISLVREVRSLLFFYIDLGDNKGDHPHHHGDHHYHIDHHSYWYLPLSTHTSLITSCLVDPVLYAPKYGVEQENILEVKEKLLLIFSLLTQANQWENSFLLPSFPHPNSSFPPFSLHQSVDDSSRSFNEKIKGLIVQFCSTVNRSLALKILHFIPLPKYSSYSEGNLLPHLWVELMEVTLRNIFIYSPEIDRKIPKKSEEVLTNNLIKLAAHSIQISISDRSSMIATCKETGSSYTLLTLLYQWRYEFLQSSRSDQSANDCWPIGLIESTINFTPNQYREFDIIPIWTFLLSSISHSHFHPVQCQSDSLKVLEYLRGVSGNNKNSASIILASKAVEIFFYKLIRGKTSIANPKADAAIELLVDQLFSLQKKDKFKQYTEFFNQVVGEILGPLFTLPYFEKQLILTLFPSAYPMLEKITLNYREQQIEIDIN